MGTGSPLPVCVSVSSSKVSSSVPKPPGRQMKALDSLMSISLRVKKYFIATYLWSPAMTELAACSKGRRMDTPIDCSRPAPSMPAAMIPGPAPVTTIHPCAARSAATRRACSYTGSSGRVRAEPKMVTFGTSSYGAKTRKASRISASAAVAILRSRRSTSSVARASATARSSRARRVLAFGAMASRRRSSSSWYAGAAGAAGLSAGAVVIAACYGRCSATGRRRGQPASGSAPKTSRDHPRRPTDTYRWRRDGRAPTAGARDGAPVGGFAGRARVAGVGAGRGPARGRVLARRRQPGGLGRRLGHRPRAGWGEGLGHPHVRHQRQAGPHRRHAGRAGAGRGGARPAGPAPSGTGPRRHRRHRRHRRRRGPGGRQRQRSQRPAGAPRERGLGRRAGLAERLAARDPPPGAAGRLRDRDRLGPTGRLDRGRGS